jgi:hypothetical protein
LEFAGALEFLSLGRNVTDMGIRFVAPLAPLKNLSIEKSRVTAKGLATISNMENLSFLCLNPLQITHDGIRHLQMMSKLQRINLSPLNLGMESLMGPAVLILKEAVPNVAVEW